MTAIASIPLRTALYARLASLPARTAHLVQSALQQLRRQQRHAADLRVLHGMSAHELRDLGLTRGELPPLPSAPVLGDDWRTWHRLPGRPD